MNELMLMKKDSGPKYEMPEVLGMGPTELIGGDATAGFFGEVPNNELITGEALATMIGLKDGYSQNSTSPWLKFVLDGKILFIPKMTFRNTISWNSINATNAVYGNREIDLLGYRFKIRLLKGINPGESATNTNGYDLPITHRSEWNRLFYPICEDNVTYPKTSQVGPNWVTYTQAELNITTGNGRSTWCQETPSNNGNYRANRGYCCVLLGLVCFFGYDYVSRLARLPRTCFELTTVFRRVSRLIGRVI